MPQRLRAPQPLNSSSASRAGLSHRRLRLLGLPRQTTIANVDVLDPMSLNRLRHERPSPIKEHSARGKLAIINALIRAMRRLEDNRSDFAGRQLGQRSIAHVAQLSL